MRSSPIPFAMLGLGIIIGAGLMLAAVPVPKTGVGCGIQPVLNKTAISYVLKPPMVDPVIIKEKCPVADMSESQKLTDQKTETLEPESKVRRHRRHYRVRRFWR